MAYCFDPCQPIGDEVRRVAAEQLRTAIIHLRVEPEPAAEDIHKARTTLKKLRSLLRLVRSHLGTATWRGLDGRLRDAGRALSGRRDADVVIATFDALADRLVDLVDPRALEAVRTGLVEDAALGGGGSTDAAAVADDLDAIRLAVPGWSIGDDGFAVVAPTIGRLHQRGRRALADLGESPDDEQLHELRKRVKDLWYQLRLLQSSWPPVTKVLAAESGVLSDALGDHHDLAVLRGVLCDRHVAAMADAAGPLLASIDDERTQLEGEARRRAARLYADSPKAWTARLRQWWHAAEAASSRPGWGRSTDGSRP